MRIALAQINPTVGDVPGNVRTAREQIRAARRHKADLVVFPELSVVGYPPRDLLTKPHFVQQSVRAVEELAGECTDLAALVGFVRPTPGGSGRPLQNAAALLMGGKVHAVHAKSLLPTYDVFDETRYFEPGGDGGVLQVGGQRLGVTICEDLWDADSLGRPLYVRDRVQELAAQGVKLIVNMAASPYHMGKVRIREELFGRQTRASGATLVYVNQVGGNDELIFDGGSCVVASDGRIFARAASFAEDLLVVDTRAESARIEHRGESLQRLWQALQLGLRDYCRKCGFASAVLGLSGGIDSALVAVLAADAIGPRNVYGISMPSRYSSDHSVSDARQLAQQLGIHFDLIPIEPMHGAFENALEEMLTGGASDVAAENVQARIRGLIVMAASNAFGHLALATGNKSELSVGYCTLYGDMAGGLAPIGDVYKTDVYRLARFINEQAGYDRIPRHIIDKPPSAELKPGQFDQDKLPPYEVLDDLLGRYIEQEQHVGQLLEAGFDEQTVRRVVQMVDNSEHKRRQAAPALKMTTRAFGSGRRMPIAQGYRQL